MMLQNKPVGSRRTFPIEEIGTVFSGECKGLGELAHQLNNLSNVVIILAISGARGRIKEVIPARQQFEYLTIA
jgi:hypothetical protein